MSEDEAQGWVEERFGRAAVDRLTLLATLVADESGKQNLVSAITLAEIWARHIVDSAQLLHLTTKSAGLWLDVGSGAGFPGLVIAILSDFDVVLAEPRAKRASFLISAARELGCGNVRVEAKKVEALEFKAEIISARAVASLVMLLGAAQKCISANTILILPKGQRAHDEVAEARRSWHGTFHVEHSVTDPRSMIVVANGVARR